MTKTTRGRYTSIIIAVLIILLTFAPWMKVSPMGAVLEAVSEGGSELDSIFERVSDSDLNLWQALKVICCVSDRHGCIWSMNANFVLLLVVGGAVSFVVVNLIFIITSLISEKKGKSFCGFVMVSCILYCLGYGLTIMAINDTFNSVIPINIGNAFSITIIPFVEIFLLVLMRYFQVPAEAVADSAVEAEVPAVEEKTAKGYFCKMCGTKNNEEAKFCQNCGAKM